MPTYEYACKACGEHLEIVQSFKDEPLTTCPVCGGDLRKVFGSIGIAFKGPGFYRTDSRPAPKAEAGGDGAKGAGKEAGTEAGKGTGKEAKAAGSEAKAAGSEAKAAGSEAKGSKASKSESASSAASP